MKYELTVELIGDPDVDVREVFPNDSEKLAADKNRYPFIAHQTALIRVKFNKATFFIANDTEYKYDGATIPFKIGKGNMKLLIPALYHDIICDDKSKVDFNRYLSSLIFRELLLQCKVNKVVAQIMFLAVDNYQRFQKGWR